jgi:predicted enzyme related to lactoylglutathione lyase
MSEKETPVGSVGWIDLTVDAADDLRDFYADVVGWKAESCDMGDYSDYSMADPGGTSRAGICHRRGANAEQPAGWMVYFVVADLRASVERAVARGAEVLSDRSAAGFQVLRDPSGAVFALWGKG